MTKDFVTVEMEGLKELEKALYELPKATAKNTGRKALRAGAQPILDEYVARVPRDSGDLAASAAISTKLSRRQGALHRKGSDRDHVEMFVGPGPDPAAVQQEFGNENHDAQPALIPAFENNKRKSLKIIGVELWKETKKAAERLARKQARLAAKK